MFDILEKHRTSAVPVEASIGDLVAVGLPELLPEDERDASLEVALVLDLSGCVGSFSSFWRPRRLFCARGGGDACGPGTGSKCAIAMPAGPRASHALQFSSSTVA